MTRCPGQPSYVMAPQPQASYSSYQRQPFVLRVTDDKQHVSRSGSQVDIPCEQKKKRYG